MDDFVLVTVSHALDQLGDVEAGFEFGEPFASADQVGQRLVVADVQHDVNVVLVFEVAVEANHVLVVQRPVDLDLARQLLAGLAPGQVHLVDHFKSPTLLRLQRTESRDLVGPGESALAKETTLFVQNNLRGLIVLLTFGRLYSFLNNLNSKCKLTSGHEH